MAAGDDPNWQAFSPNTDFTQAFNPAYPTTLATNIFGWGKLNALLLVNLPQFLVSLVNVLYNGCLTSQNLMAKWNSFSQRRQSLRVTVPLGQQKSQHYLTVPYRYAIPFLAITGIYHWLISESFFRVSLTALKDTEIQPQDSIFGIGYSAVSIGLSFVVCFTMLILLFFRVGGDIK
jgi:hypothetical protein